MHFPGAITLLLASLVVSGVQASPTCTSEKRLAGARLIPRSYNKVTPGESAAGFARLPLADDCHTLINANGAPPVTVAIDSATTRDFALTTRQVFSKVTGAYTDYANGTTIIATNVTLGALHSVAVPVTFSANVYLTYDLGSCLMKRIQAFATIPSVVAGQPVTLPPLDDLIPQ